MSEDQHSDDLVRLDLKLSRAAAKGKGIKLTAAEIDLMTAIGMMAVLSEAKAKLLKEQAEARQRRNPSHHVDHVSGPSEYVPVVSAGRARAQRIFR